MTKTKCNHHWNHEQSVYGGPRSGSLIRKWCDKCGLELVGQVSRWRAPRPGEFGESAAEAAKEN